MWVKGGGEKGGVVKGGVVDTPDPDSEADTPLNPDAVTPHPWTQRQTSLVLDPEADTPSPGPRGRHPRDPKADTRLDPEADPPPPH